jgi:hypothetical protein
LRNILYLKSELVTSRGIDSPSASPELHGGKHSLPRKVPLRNATGISHPIAAIGAIPENTKSKTRLCRRALDLVTSLDKGGTLCISAYLKSTEL